MLSFLKSHNTIYLALFSVFCISLLFVRFLLIDGTFLFLTINLALAWIPYLLSYVFRIEKINKVVLISVGFAWLLFFPNALYIVTDLLNCTRRNFVSHWFDLTMMISFAITGLFLAFGALKNLEDFLIIKTEKTNSKIAIFLTLYIGSQGFYFGRFIRLNSWEVITQPLELFEKVLSVFSSPLDDVNFYAIPFLYTILLSFFYYGLFHFGKNHLQP
jgi:uncharacterized membrane protein